MNRTNNWQYNDPHTNKLPNSSYHQDFPLAKMLQWTWLVIFHSQFSQWIKFKRQLDSTYHHHPALGSRAIGGPNTPTPNHGDHTCSSLCHDKNHTNTNSNCTYNAKACSCTSTIWPSNICSLRKRSEKLESARYFSVLPGRILWNCRQCQNRRKGPALHWSQLSINRWQLNSSNIELCCGKTNTHQLTSNQVRQRCLNMSVMLQVNNNYDQFLTWMNQNEWLGVFLSAAPSVLYKFPHSKFPMAFHGINLINFLYPSRPSTGRSGSAEPHTFWTNIAFSITPITSSFKPHNILLVLMDTQNPGWKPADIHMTSLPHCPADFHMGPKGETTFWHRRVLKLL